MTEIVRRFLRQKFRSVGTVTALAVLALLTAFPVATGGGEHALESGGFLALLVLAAASVSKDASSGALQMILARPIRRVDYLFGRFCGVLLGYGISLAATVPLAVALSLWLPRLVGGASAISPGGLARGALGSLLSAALLASILLFFSTFLPGYGDVLAYFLLSLLLGLPGILAGPLRAPWLSRVGSVARENVLPRVAWEEVLRGDNVFAVATGQFVLAVTVYLALAAWIFSRREFSYGHD